MDEQQFHHAAHARFRDTQIPDEPSVKPGLNPGEAEVGVSSLTRGSALAAAKAARAAEATRYDAELRAGMRAIRLGLVSSDEAMQRLRTAFPVHARELAASDLGA